MMIVLSGKVALITGAASGIGLATAQALVAEGAYVALCDRSKENLQKAEALLGENARSFVVNLLDAAAVELLISRVIDAFGKLDIVHANAGIYLGGDVATGDPDSWDALLALNINSVLRLIRSALPYFKDRGEGDIIVTSSISAHMVVPHEPIYNASKHAVQAFVHSLREQLSDSGIRISEISPGLTITPLLESWPSEMLAPLLERKGALSPHEVAEAIIFMLSRPRSVVIRDLVILAQSSRL